MYQSISLKFDGNLASKNYISMKELGKSLVGVDRVINSGLIMMSYGRLPKRGESFNLTVATKEPLAGSYEIIAVLHQIPGLLPLVHEFIVTGGTEAIFRFVSYVMTKLGGRKSDAEAHMNALLELNRNHLEASRLSQQDWQNMILTLVDKLVPQARETITPIGKTANTLAIGTEDGRLVTQIDEPMAEAIRSKEDDEVGDLQEMTIKVDGIIHHSKQLKVENPELEGRYLTAKVLDPIFEVFPNVYSEAASSLSLIDVLVKPLFRNGKLHSLYIMDTIKK